MGSWPIWISLGILLLAGVSFFCALAETAFFTLTKWQVRQLGEQRGARGQQARAV
jgi:CBS domain containing-hemolysin-like protein